MKKYTAIIPFIDDMGSVADIKGVWDKPTETKEEEVLWHLNKMREHDRLPMLSRLPRGVRFISVEI